MRNHTASTPFASATLIAILLAFGACTTTPQVNTGAGAEPSFDGLMPLKGTSVSRAWIRPDFDLSGYTKVMLVGAGIQYRPAKEGSASAAIRSGQSEFAMSEKQKEDLRALITEEFGKALDRLTRYERVTAPGPDVLLVRGAFIDVVSRVPPEAPGRTDYYLDSVGQATFVVELLDSQSEAVLVRAVDTRAAETPGYSYRSNRVTNTAEARRLFARWADMLVDALNELSSNEALMGGG